MTLIEAHPPSRGVHQPFTKMGRKPHFGQSLSLWLILFCIHFNATPVRATITVHDYWRMGENDPGAVADGAVTDTVDIAGTYNLAFVGSGAVYSTTVDSTALNHTDSTLSVDLAGSTYASHSVVSPRLNNFGIEAWVNPTEVTNDQIIAYNGDTGTSGWGIMISGSTYSALYGGVIIFGTTAAVPGVWTHVALVRDNGMATLYVDGVAAGTSTVTPYPPEGGFALGAPPSNPTNQFFTGYIDEVRLFSFVPGQFSPSDLLWNQNIILTEGPAAGADSTSWTTIGPQTSWTATNTASWLQLIHTNGTGPRPVGFTFAANTGAPRTGTITIGSETMVVEQAGVNYVPAGPITLVRGGVGRNGPSSVAVDNLGNVYFSEPDQLAIDELTTTKQQPEQVITALGDPGPVAVDGSGNIYFTDADTNAIEEWNVASQMVTNLVSGFSNAPTTLALDDANNVYFITGDTSSNSIDEWNATDGTVSNLTTIPSDSETAPTLAVDTLGKVYLNDFDTLSQWSPATQTLMDLTSLSGPGSLAADSGGNVYVADGSDNTVAEWNAASQTLTNLGLNLADPVGVAVDGARNLYTANDGNDGKAGINELPRAFLVAAPRFVSSAAGTDSLPPVVPSTADLTSVLRVPTSNQSWLTIAGISNGVVTYTFTANTGLFPRTANITLLGQVVSVTQAAVFGFGTISLVEGPTAGADSVELTAPKSTHWTNSANATWLHVSYTAGIGSTNLAFTFDANTGANRTGTLTIAGATITITQAGVNYRAAGPQTLTSSPYITGVAVDAAGNLYFADATNSTVQEWSPANSTVTTLVASGLNDPTGLALDAGGNLYIADTGNNAIDEWIAGNQLMTTLISHLSSPEGVAVDNASNIYFANTGANTVERESLSGSSQSTYRVNNGAPGGMALDLADNVYFPEINSNTIVEWTPSGLSATNLVAAGLANPADVAVDGGGNVYIANTGAGAIEEWNVANRTLATLGGGFNAPRALAVDGADNLYLADTGNGALKELPHAYLSGAGQTEAGQAGTDSLPPIVPATVNLSGLFYPTTDQPWLTIASAANGLVTYAFAANTTGTSRTAHITLLGQQITVTQTLPALLGTTNLVEGPVSGADSVLLAAAAPTVAWNASANASWLHLVNTSGTGSTNVGFTFDVNPGPTRTGTLTLDGTTITITQAGSAYLPAGIFNLISSYTLEGVAADTAGNVYVTDTGLNAVDEWNPVRQVVSNLISSGLSTPTAVTVDGAGNLYIANTGSNAIDEWNPTNPTLIPLIISGLSSPAGVAVDNAGNVYVDTGSDAVDEWSVTNHTLTTLVSGLQSPQGLAVDSAGNVYLNDTIANLTEEWSPLTRTLTPLANAGPHKPEGVALDGGGNVYVANLGSVVIKEWNSVYQTTNNVGVGLADPVGVALDSADDVFIVDLLSSATLKAGLEEVPRAFVSGAPQQEPATAGTDTLPPVVPATANLTGVFQPTVYPLSPWLSITGVTNGIVSYAFTALTNGPSRTAYINVLGQSNAVTQSGFFVVGSTNLVEGPGSGVDDLLLAAPLPNTHWSASPSVAWLHPLYASGIGSTNFGFTFDANTGPTRIGTMAVAGQTVTVTQAGTNYVNAGVVTLVSAGVDLPRNVTVDSAGNVYVADTGNFEVEKWTPSGQTLSFLFSDGLYGPAGIAVAGSFNVYVTDLGNEAVKEWTPGTVMPTTLIGSGLSDPEAVAVDDLGNLYIANTGDDAIEEWTATNQTVTNLLISGLNNPEGVAVDLLGNVYFADTYDQVIGEWNPASQTTTYPVTAGLNFPEAVAVDNGGNIYIADTYHEAIKEWNAASQTTTTLAGSGLDVCEGVAVDGARNVYIADSGNNAIKELPQAFVPAGPAVESSLSGSDSLPPVVPSGINLTGIFYPTSDQPWLTVSGVTNGVVSYNFTANNTATNRVAHLTVLGVSVAVSQPPVAATPPVLTNLSLVNGGLEFTFTNNPAASFTVLSSTNLMLPMNEWTVAGTATNISGNVFQFIALANTNSPQMFYRVHSP